MRITPQACIGATALCLGAAPSWADCGIPAGSVRILSNDFDAMRVLGSAVRECASDSVEVTLNQTIDHKDIQVPALTTDPATYTVAVIANNSVTPLLNAGLVRPLDDLVEEHGQELLPEQLVRIDGKVMAIAFMINAQHLYYREDLLAEAGLEPPSFYEAILEAAATFEEKGILDNPLGANFQPPWDLATEFVNMFLGYGGEFFAAGSAEPAVNNETGVAALEMMKALSEHMGAEYMTFNTNELKPRWEAGEIAIMNQWGSRAGSIIDPNGPAPEVAAQTVLAAAPTVGGGSVPATALWWEGFTIARNVSDEDAEASFRAMLHAVRPEVAAANPNAAAWLVKGYEPTPAVSGIIATARAGARPYPAVPYMGLLHTALGNELAEFMQGREDAAQALTDVENAYRTMAQEAGFIQ
jgi:ABC-type glycerol-3-phosphate transport system substrate-binding protein